MNAFFVLASAGLLLTATATAQHPEHPLRLPFTGGAHNQPPPAPSGNRAVIWSDDFADPGTWVITNEPDAFPSVAWQIGVGLESTGQFGTPALQSTTATDGYAMLCSDCGQNENSTVYEKCNLTTAAPIDLSAYPDVTLEFQTMYRRYTNEQCYVAISTDGVNWPQPPTDTATVNLPLGLYPVWGAHELPLNVAVPNPSIKRIVITDAAGGRSQVWVRFYFYGIYGYAWYVDDVNIVEYPLHDLAMTGTFFSHMGTGDQYSRVPVSQLGSLLQLGGSVINGGLNAQTDVVMHMETRDAGSNIVLSHSCTPFDLGSAATSSTLEEVSISSWPAGVYHTRYWCTSNENADDPFTDNDTLHRVLEVTPDNGVYSLDGLGVHPNGPLDAYGTNTWPEYPGGIFCMTRYLLEQEATVYGLEVVIAPGSGPGAELIAYMLDTLDAYPPENNVHDPYITSPTHTLTQGEIDNRSCIIPFNNPYPLDPTIGWLAAVELHSNNDTNHVRVQDDLSFLQPWGSSAVQLLDVGETYSNGNAFGIRLLLDPTIGMDEREELRGVNVFPNPTNGLVNLLFTVQGNYQVDVINTLGQVVVSQRLQGNTTMDMSALAKGTYCVRIANTQAATVQRITLN